MAPEVIKEEMKHNLLVTLSDFGGEKDQSLLNTGLLAAAPGKQTWDLLEDWIRTELYGQADEQEHLVYEIAPRAKEEGKKIHGMPHQMFPELSPAPPKIMFGVVRWVHYLN